MINYTLSITITQQYFIKEIRLCLGVGPNYVPFDCNAKHKGCKSNEIIYYRAAAWLYYRAAAW